MSAALLAQRAAADHRGGPHHHPHYAHHDDGGDDPQALAVEAEAQAHLLAKQAQTIARLQAKVREQRETLGQKEAEELLLAEKTLQLEHEIARRQNLAMAAATATATAAGSTVGGGAASSSSERSATHESVDQQLHSRRQQLAELRRQLAEERASHMAFAEQASHMSQSIELALKDAVERERQREGREIDPDRDLLAIADIAAQREEAARRLQEELQIAASEKQRRAEELHSIQETVRRELPVVAAKKEDERLRIQGTWERERQGLLQEYRALLAINKEQRFHLHRGTSVKGPDGKPVHRAGAALGIGGASGPEVDRRAIDQNRELAEAVKELRQKATEAKEQKRELQAQHQSILRMADEEHAGFAEKKRLREEALKQERRQLKKLQEAVEDLKRVKEESLAELRRLRHGDRDFERKLTREYQSTTGANTHASLNSNGSSARRAGGVLIRGAAH